MSGRSQPNSVTDENPYQSPPADTDEIEIAQSIGDRPPPSRREIVFFGGMVGVLFHSAAGFIAGIVYAGEQVVLATGFDLVAIATVGTVLSIAGAIVGVTTGLIAGSTFSYVDCRSSHAAGKRRIGWWISRGLHVIGGGMVGYWFVAYGQWAELLTDGWVSPPGYRLTLAMHVVTGMLAGWSVAVRMERRFLDRMSMIGIGSIGDQ